MTDKELLEAIDGLLNKKLEPIRSDIQGLRSGMEEIRTDLQEVKERVDYIAGVVEGSLALHDELEERVKILEKAI